MSKAPNDKPTGPDMRRDWRAELKDIRTRQRKLQAEHKAATRMTTKAIVAVQKKAQAFIRDARRQETRCVRALMKEMRTLTTRAQILEGRLG